MNEFIDQYKAVVMGKYAVFTGRAGRREFWSFVLVNLIIGILIGILRVQALSALYSLAVLVPSLAVGVRRLHDTNRSGWYLLLCLIPVVGTIILIVFAAQPGQPGANRFGASPAGSATHPAPETPAAPPAVSQE